ncbi:hypothetical protein [uncultured Oxalicibacterium sp.]|uniref:hypothetical protein n=1 Tax=uncultured Oxalicibacterium sp. TaxID=1168540 RepID=UPI0025D60753|nr:hypothetical protein [uncultured Oxalicibacterium sp.]
MGEELTLDEFSALKQIAAMGWQKTRPSACVARNIKRLTGLKYVSHTKGMPTLTEKGKQTLFLHQCVEALCQLDANASLPVPPDVATFLERKGHVSGNATDGFVITAKGKECLDDINSRAKVR